ncbi:unnamed protein product [Durusdinium trenchii]|uniref:Uncharacterized protein n=1 Tax=Durusdinium trenchii TaxID=1381693 RepID=A0ABP0MQE5_9DINO
MNLPGLGVLSLDPNVCGAVVCHLGVDQAREMAERPSLKPKPLQVVPLHGTLPKEQQLKAFVTPARGNRKVVVATNLAEASVTIDGIVYVVDSCLVKLDAFCPFNGTSYLNITACSKGSARQRCGRAGRTRAGHCFRLLTESAYHQLHEHTLPEVQRSDLKDVVLTLKCLGVDDVGAFEFPTPPAREALEVALEDLYALGAIDAEARLVEPLGLRMAHGPLPAPLMRLLLLSVEEPHRCAAEASIACAMLTMQPPWLPSQNKDRLLNCKESFAVYEGDLVSVLNIYRQYEVYREKDPEWAKRHLLNAKLLDRAMKVKQQLGMYLAKFNLPEESCGSEVERLQRVACASLFLNSARRLPNGTYRLCGEALTDYAAVYAQAAAVDSAELGEKLTELLQEPRRGGEPKRRRLSNKTPAPVGVRDPIETWLPRLLAAGLPRLSGALVKDHRGLSVLPHPHRMEKKILTSGACHLTISGIAYHTKRACDNCDRPIEDRVWFACAEGCEVDFCCQCHEHLQTLFETGDGQRAVWASRFAAQVAQRALQAPAEERQAFIDILAFDWPLQMFQDLVRALADVADAQVVHLQDGADMDVAADADFWHLVGFLQLLRCANQKPAKERRFGELMLRGPRVPESHFVLGGLDKCDAQAEWERWKRYKDHVRPPEEVVLQAEFQVSGAFALFLVQGPLVPLSFRERCLEADLEDRLVQVKRPVLSCQVPRRPPRSLRLGAAKALSRVDQLKRLEAHFTRERGRGLGVMREFLALAMEAFMSAKSGKNLEEGQALWDYDPNTRTFWFSELPAPLSAQCQSLFRACGVLLAQALLNGTRLQVSFPPLLYSLLLRHIGASAPRLGLTDLASLRPSLAKGLQELLQYEGSDVGEVFPLDWPRGHELCSSNRAEHVEAFVEWFFTEKFRSQLKPFLDGFKDVLHSCDFLQTLVNASQLEQILCGVEEPLDVQQLKVKARVEGFDHDFKEIFWSVLESLDDEQKRRFALFVSACDRRPPEGWQHFELQVQRNGEDDDRLPTVGGAECLHLLHAFIDATLFLGRGLPRAPAGGDHRDGGLWAKLSKLNGVSERVFFLRCAPEDRTTGDLGRKEHSE